MGARSVFTVLLKKSASVEGLRMYIGDGKVALELVAHATHGIFLQGVKHRQGDQWELKPRDVSVKLPGVNFTMPATFAKPR